MPQFSCFWISLFEKMTRVSNFNWSAYFVSQQVSRVSWVGGKTSFSHSVVSSSLKKILYKCCDRIHWANHLRKLCKGMQPSRKKYTLPGMMSDEFNRGQKANTTWAVFLHANHGPKHSFHSGEALYIEALFFSCWNGTCVEYFEN